MAPSPRPPTSCSAHVPNIEVDYHTLGRIPGEEVGGVVIHLPARSTDGWWIRDDLTDVVRASTNYAAEKRVRKALATENPLLLSRLSFDTESAAVVIHAESEDDIRAVAELIGRLANSRGAGDSRN
jgi:hypothetical protein